MNNFKKIKLNVKLDCKLSLQKNIKSTFLNRKCLTLIKTVFFRDKYR